MDLVREIRERFQLLITIYIFFSALVYGFYKAIGSDELISNSNSFSLAIGVTFLIVSYLLIEYVNKSKVKILNWVKHLTSLNLILFVVPIIVFTITMKNSLPGWYELPFKISFYGILYIPIVNMLLISGIISFWAGFNGGKKFGDKILKK